MKDGSLEENIRKLENVALMAIGHVGYANYQERVDTANRMVEKTAQYIIDNMNSKPEAQQTQTILVPVEVLKTSKGEMEYCQDGVNFNCDLLREESGTCVRFGPLEHYGLYTKHPSCIKLGEEQKGCSQCPQAIRLDATYCMNCGNKVQ